MRYDNCSPRTTRFRMVSAVRSVLPKSVNSARRLAELLEPAAWMSLVEAEDLMWDRHQAPDMPGACKRLADAVRGLLGVGRCVVLTKAPGGRTRWQLAVAVPRGGRGPD